MVGKENLTYSTLIYSLNILGIVSIQLISLFYHVFYRYLSVLFISTVCTNRSHS